VAYDQDLADRIREVILDQPDVAEQRMFGGLAFLVNGNLAVSANRQGGLLVRVQAEDRDRLVAAGRAERAVMGGRTMHGWVRVAPEAVRTKRQLSSWVSRGVTMALAQPPKASKSRRPRN
jgi:TfoX/Sxy family transcriptional regulator of competence genes